MATRQERIQHLARRNLLSQRLPEFSARLSAVLGQAIGPERLALLDDADALMQVFGASYGKVMRAELEGSSRFFSENDAHLVWEGVSDLQRQLADEVVFALIKIENDVVAFSIQLSCALASAEAIVCFDGDSLRLLSTDGTQGILVDYNDGDLIENFQIALWGDRWARHPQGIRSSFGRLSGA